MMQISLINNHRSHLAKTASLWEVGQQQVMSLQSGVAPHVATPPERSAETGIPPEVGQSLMVLGHTKQYLHPQVQSRALGLTQVSKVKAASWLAVWALRERATERRKSNAITPFMKDLFQLQTKSQTVFISVESYYNKQTQRPFFKGHLRLFEVYSIFLQV